MSYSFVELKITVLLVPDFSYHVLNLFLSVFAFKNKVFGKNCTKAQENQIISTYFIQGGHYDCTDFAVVKLIHFHTVAAAS